MNYFSSFFFYFPPIPVKLLSDDVATHSQEKEKGIVQSKTKGYLTSLFETIKCPEYSFRKLAIQKSA